MAGLGAAISLCCRIFSRRSALSKKFTVKFTDSSTVKTGSIRGHGLAGNTIFRRDGTPMNRSDRVNHAELSMSEVTAQGAEINATFVADTSANQLDDSTEFTDRSDLNRDRQPDCVLQKLNAVDAWSNG